LIQYAFEEALNSGVEEFIFITGRNKDAIMDHFDHSFELEQTLSKKDKLVALGLTKSWMPDPGNITFIRQQEPLGLGHAVWCARKFVCNEPFAVLLADELMMSEKPCLAQMIELYEQTNGCVIAVDEVPNILTSNYGIITPEGELKGNSTKVIGMVEKPKPEDAPSNLAIVGRYILKPEIFAHLGKHRTGSGGEIQLTDAMVELMKEQDFYGLKFEGQRFDCGSKLGFLEANVAYACNSNEYGAEFKEILKKYIG
jgi:UTP-glucose-1-phosphate uridylyltransferase